MENYLKIRSAPEDKVSSNTIDVIFNINNIQSTASDFGSGIIIMTNNSIGNNGFAIELKNAAGVQATTEPQCREALNAVNDAIFNAKPGQGVITLGGQFKYVDGLEFTQIF